ncbi:diguanylate cyclase domain-containing protein [Chungangia koreensis]|uniref:Diguanylate cyclase domain-containing protein n=1 Tax=Chungangia koreensis TaxID=752657 RepID=A0ABV8X633_9LACT
MKTLRFWILLLISITMIGLLTIGLTSAYFVTKDNLIEDSLKVNKEFSEKLAHDTNQLFVNMQSTLNIVANEIPYIIDNQELLEDRLERVLKSSSNFNSMSVVGVDRVVVATSPDVGITGKMITSSGSNEALMAKKPTISQPFTAATGRLIVLISAPIWNDHGEYLGYVGGTIYLEEENSLQQVLGIHFANNGSYVWVTDVQGNIIYHPDQNRIGDAVLTNEITQKVMKGKSGSQRVINTLGKEFLASYTFLPVSQWGIVSQTPYEAVVEPVAGIIKKMFWLVIPFMILLLLLSVLLANKIAYPLQKLAIHSQNLRQHGMSERPDIPTWYFEAKQLNEIINAYAMEQKLKMDNLEETSFTDSLTGLKNRRYMEAMTKGWISQGLHFSAILIDIDRFKLVNDTYGHKVGDEVLQFLSKTTSDIVNKDGLPIRLGGEEFLILLPESDLANATQIAEKLREYFERTDSPTGVPINISAGVGEYSSSENYSDFLHRVDLALYEAKSNGRNQVRQSII